MTPSIGRCPNALPLLLERFEELGRVHLEAITKPGQSGEGEVHLGALHAMEETRRQAAAMGRRCWECRRERL